MSGSTVEKHLKRMGPQGLFEALRPFVSDERLRRIEDVLEHRIANLRVVLVRLHDPLNGAAALRTSEAMGLMHVHTVEDTEPFRSVSGVAMGAEKWLSLHRHTTYDGCVSTLRQEGFKVWAMVPEVSLPLEDLDLSVPAAFVFGNERDGLTSEQIARCDGAVRLPGWGFTTNYNLSVSVALCLALVVTKYRALYGQSREELTSEERSQIRARWIYKMVKAADSILMRSRNEGSC